MPFKDYFFGDVLLLVIDKVALGLIVLVAGYVVNKMLEQHRSKLSLANDLQKLQIDTQIKFIERQLSQFFWPVLLKFEKDSSLWRRIPRLSSSADVLPKDIGDMVEMLFLLPNHQEAVRIIESNIHLVQDNVLIQLLQQYIKHVAVYTALRTSNSDLNPIDVKERYPDGLPELLKNKTLELQSRYNELVGLSLATHLKGY